MTSSVTTEQLSDLSEYQEELSELLIQIVESGASIGFIPPMTKEDAADYWDSLGSDDMVLFVAKIDKQIAGTVQLHLCTKQNGTHRAEIAKLMTHLSFQRKGIGRLLMEAAEEMAKQKGRSLIVLDTREGDVSNHLYVSMGYSEAGKIPSYARSVSGELDPTVIYYKLV